LPVSAIGSSAHRNNSSTGSGFSEAISAWMGETQSVMSA
jgi:hypothetical protein